MPITVDELLHGHTMDAVNFEVATGFVHIDFTGARPTVTFTGRGAYVTFRGNNG